LSVISEALAAALAQTVTGEDAEDEQKRKECHQNCRRQLGANAKNDGLFAPGAQLQDVVLMSNGQIRVLTSQQEQVVILSYG
jgi:bifunctional pyridoxal-dependent enzyme with beta-cystathionase and maltose regulon repressor activities